MHTKISTVKPRSLEQWLRQFSARLVDVPANGNCFWGALHVTSTGIGAGKVLRYTSDAVIDVVQLLKEQVLQTVQALNTKELSYGLAGQEALFLQGQRILPEINWGSILSADEACQLLNDRYEKSADILIEDPAPPRYWAGPPELLVTAVKMKEPLYVFDVVDDGPLTVHRYSSRPRRDAQGEWHGEGYEFHLTMDVFDSFVRNSAP